MAREFDIPEFYRSSSITALKLLRGEKDHRKRDFQPTSLDLGPITLKIARHFGFCFGVQNAIEIAYRAIEENPGKRIFLLSEMIHNPHVNEDLCRRGVRFLRTAEGEQLIPFSDLKPEDVVIIPAFGTTVELFERLSALGINFYQYNTTCPFVEKVWKRASELGKKGYSIVVHGRYRHEETRATFSHAQLQAPTVVIRDMEMGAQLRRYILGELEAEQFYSDFREKHSEGFDPSRDLARIGVVNQTTMLATETEEISEMLKEAMRKRYGDANLVYHFADTRDTLCYATSENQRSVEALIESGGDLAIIVGGYNSSNTSHLVEMCAHVLPAFHIKDASEIIDEDRIRHLDQVSGIVRVTEAWLPRAHHKVEILITAGASCPDALVDQVIKRLASFFGAGSRLDHMLGNSVE